ncbi:MAG TPA: hypothetical protein VGD41_01575 [Pyrinomonadaceae bacterium]
MVGQSGGQQRRFSGASDNDRLIAITEDGSRLAVVPASSLSLFQVIEQNGESHSSSAYLDYSGDTDVDRRYQSAPLVSLSWSGPEILRLEKHISPDLSRFEFYRVTPSGAISRISRPSIGSACEINPANTSEVACVRGGSLELNGVAVVRANALDHGSTAAELDLPMGDLVPTNVGGVAFSVRFRGMSNGLPTLEVVFADGASSRQAVPLEGYFSIRLGDQAIAFVPTEVSSANAHILVKIVPGDDELLAPIVIWQGNRERVLLFQNLGNASMMAAQRSSSSSTWSVSPSLVVSEGARINSAQFLADSSLMLSEDSGASTVGVSINDAPLQVVLGQAASFPHTVNVDQNGSTVSVAPMQWICRNQ